MKLYIYLLCFIFTIISFNVLFVDAQCSGSIVSTWSSGVAANNHSYCIVQSAYSNFYDAVNTFARFSEYQGKQPYLATITSEEEFLYVKSQFGNTYVSSLSRFLDYDKWVYESGPEKGELHYQYSSAVGTLFDNWLFQFPYGEPSNNYASYSTSGLQSVSFSTSSNFYLLEYSDLNDPYVPPVSTRGGNVTMRYLENFVVEDVSIIVTQYGNGGIPTPVPIVSREPLYKRLVFTMPPMNGLGVNFILITDGTTSFNITYWKYKAPALMSLYPTTNYIDIITIVGDNFGTDRSLITVKAGKLFNPCLYVDIIEPHTAITCQTTHPIADTNSLLPISVRVGMSSNITSHKIAFYDKKTMRMIRLQSYADVYINAYNSILQQRNFLLDGHTGYIGVLDSASQFDIYKKVYAFSTYPQARGWTSLVGDGTGALVKNNGYYLDGIKVVNGSTTCIGIYCPGGTFSSQVTSNSYSTLTSTNYVSSQFGATGGELIMYGIPPVIQPQQLQIDAAGGMIIVPLYSGTVGFKYTNRTYAIDGVTQPYPINVINNHTLGITIPPGIKLSFNLSISIENYTFTGLQVNYTTPSVLSVPPVSTLGGPVTIYGYSFGSDSSKLNITIDGVPCSNAIILVNETIISCIVAPGVGGGKQMVIQVGDTSQTVPFSYIPPKISNVVQNGLQITIFGDNFGNNVTAPTVDIRPHISDGPVYQSNTSPQVLNLTVPVYAQNGMIRVNAGNQNGVSNYVFQPRIDNVTQPLSTDGGIISIVGRFLTQYRFDGTQTSFRVLIGGRTCTLPQFQYDSNGTYVQCQVPSGSGLANDIYVTVDGKTSNFLTVDYPAPSLDSVVQNGQVITITGSNFGSELDRIRVNINGNPFTATSVLLNPSRIILTIPSATLNGFINVTVQGQVSNTLPLILRPSISSVTSQTIYGGLITVRGLYFNLLDYLGNPVVLNISTGGVSCQDVKIVYQNTVAQCKVAPGTGKTTLNFTLGSNPSIIVPFTYLSPYITSIQTIAPQDPSQAQQIMINGTDIGNDINKIGIYVVLGTPGNTVIITPTVVLGSSPITQSLAFDIPFDMLNGFITISVDGLSSNTVYARIPPIIKQTIGSPLLTTGGMISIIGDHFYNIRGDGITTNFGVVVGAYLCNGLNMVSSQLLTCNVYQNVGLNVRGYITKDYIDSTPFYVNFIAPNLTSVNAVVSGPSQYLDVVGNAFGYAPDKVQFQFGSNETVANSFSTTQTTSRAFIPFFTLNGNLTLVVAGQPTNNTLPYKLVPMISAITSCDYVGGIITVTGMFLNGKRSDGSLTNTTVYFPNNVQCTNITFLPNDLIARTSSFSCNAPPGSGTDLNVVVQIDGINGTVKFTYGSPSLVSYSITRTNLLTLSGTQFGTVAANIQVYIGSVLVAIQTITDTDIVLQVPTTTTIFNNYVYVKNTANGKSSSTLFVRLYPIVKTVQPSQTQGSRCTITGNYLNAQSSSYSSSILVTVNGVVASLYYATQTNNSMLIITSPPGTGTGLNLTVSIDGLSSSITTFNYLPPTIFNTIQNGLSLTFNGTNYGRNTLVTYTTPFSPISYIFDTLLTITLAQDAKNGPYNIMVDGQQTALYNVNLCPIINSVSQAPTSGGSDITIGGYLFNRYRADGNMTNSTVTVSGLPCPITQFISNTQITCTVPSGLYRNAVLSLTIDGCQTNSTYASLGPEILSVLNPPLYQQPALITINGRNFYDPVVAYIDTVECTNAVTINSSMFTCNFDSSVQPSVSLISVRVISTNLVGMANVFRYADLKCPNNCSGNGVCRNGICGCNYGFAGYDCHANVDLTIPIPQVGPYYGNITVENITTYNINLAFIRELDQFGMNVKVFKFSDFTWILDTVMDRSIYTITRYRAFLGESTIIIVDTYQFTNGALLQFGGEPIAEASHSFKHQISVQYWQFEGASNTLQIIYDINTPKVPGIPQSCTPSQTQTNIDYSSETNELMAFDYETLYSIFTVRFTTRILIDQSIQIINIGTLDPSDPIWLPQSGLVQSMITIDIPQFAQSIEFDPNFSAYKKNDSSCNFTPTTTSGSTTGVSTSTTTSTVTTTSTSTATTGVDSTTTSSSTGNSSTTTTTTTTSSNSSTTSTTSNPTTTSTTTVDTSTTTSGGQTSSTLNPTTTATSIPTITSSGSSSGGDTITCPGTPVCGGHGLCVGQLGVYTCQCYGDWTGVDCTSEPGKIPPPVDPNTNNPGTNQTDKTGLMSF